MVTQTISTLAKHIVKEEEIMITKFPAAAEFLSTRDVSPSIDGSK